MNTTTGYRNLVVLMIVAAAILFAGCGKQPAAVPSQPAAGGTKKIVDMAGRTVEVPATIRKVYTTSPVGTILTYTLDPHKLGAWNYFMPVRESRYILPECRSLPVIDGWLGSNNFGNLEEILKLQPDVILYVRIPGSSDKDLADMIQKRTGLPVVTADITLEKMDAAYEFAGNLLGQEERGKLLAEYCRSTIQDIREKSSQIAVKKKVYYSEGIKGLETEPRGSMHTAVIEMLAENVAGTEIGNGGPTGRAQVSLEQVMNWDPDVMIVAYFPEGETSSYENILTDGKWQNLRAAKGREVYEVPNAPFNWIDRPPSVNRVIGVKWMANLLYPDVYSYNMADEVKKFYRLFYQYQLTDQETEELLKRSRR